MVGGPGVEIKRRRNARQPLESKRTKSAFSFIPLWTRPRSSASWRNALTVICRSRKEQYWGPGEVLG